MNETAHQTVKSVQLMAKTLLSFLFTAIGVILCFATIVATASKADALVVNDRPVVGLVLLDNLMSGRSKVGDVVHFETVAPVYDSQSNLLIPAGSYATGSVTRSKGSGMFGKRGQLDFTCDFVTLQDGSHIPLTGNRISGGGANDTAATAAVTVLVSPLGLLIKGGTVKYDQGTPIRMYIADGAVINPPGVAPPNIKADFSLRDKHAQDIVGTVISFDGDAYAVHSKGRDVQVSLSDIATISLNVPDSN
jgi:hypothetical protein